MRDAWSLAWLTIKGRPHGFVAAFVAVLAGAALITATGVLFESGLRGGGEPERCAGAVVVVGADQNLPVPEDLDLTFGERVTLVSTRRTGTILVRWPGAWWCSSAHGPGVAGHYDLLGLRL